MKIAKLSANEVNAKAKTMNVIKVTSRKSNKHLADLGKIKQNLPENTNVKKNKYFGQPYDPNGNYEVTQTDVITAIGAIAVGLGLAFL